jgi:hypothetical protein
MSKLDAISAPGAPPVANPAIRTGDKAAPLKGLQHGGVLSDFVREVALPLHLGNRQTAALLIARRLNPKTTEKIKDDRHANTLLTAFLQYLLDGQRYVDAATLL